MTENKTVDAMVGELTREISSLRSQIAAYCEPVRERIKQAEKKIERLLLEDGRQQVDLVLFGDD
jgi:phage host-nuclease inhibitor protein Gam